MKLVKTLLLVSFSLVMFLSIACEDNKTEDPAPESATLTGLITFTGEWPANGTVAVSLSPTWPPTGAPAASSAISSSDLSNNTYTYTFENVTFGSYASIAISWQDPNDTNPMTNQYILGAYGGIFPFFTAYGGTDPAEVTVSETEYELTGLDFGVDLSLAQP